ncbi:MAG TPA: hypothetical protein VG960_07935 [Caulobacteraceae bacterium]|nr:hypothetical protein [Caulobacteraceae bacterium]
MHKRIKAKLVPDRRLPWSILGRMAEHDGAASITPNVRGHMVWENRD